MIDNGHGLETPGAVLTENLFMDQPDDCRFLLSDEGRDIIVDLHLSAIKRIVKLSKENHRNGGTGTVLFGSNLSLTRIGGYEGKE